MIGSNVILYPHTYIGQYAVIGDDSILYSNVTVRERCRLGRRVIIHSSTVIGADGFGFTTTNGVHTKVPQVGNAVLEDDVEIGAHVGIDRATTGSTIIGQGTKIDNLVHIGHNCHIGANNLIVAQTGISGSTNVGHNVTFGGQVGTVGHIDIGANSVFAARSGIIGNTPEGVFYAGFPAKPHQEWLRMVGGASKIVQDVVPYTIVDGHPAKVVGLNSVGISRAGIPVESRRNIKKAYKLLYRSGLSLAQAIEMIEQEVDSCEEVDHFLRFLRNAERGICRSRRETDNHDSE